MKQKTTNNNPVTEEELKEVLKENPTKDGLTKRLVDSQESFRKELHHQFEIQNENWEKRFNTLFNQINSIVDPLLQEIKTRQQEREIVA